MRYQPDNPTRADTSRPTRMAMEQYRERFPGRSAALDDRSLRVRIAAEEQSAKEIEVPDRVLDRILRAEGKRITFKSNGDPRDPYVDYPVFVSTPDGIVTVMSPQYWREQIVRHLTPHIRISSHAIDRFQERMPHIHDGSATILDVAEAFARASVEIDVPTDRSVFVNGEGHNRPANYVCEVDPRIDPGNSAPVFVLSSRIEGEDHAPYRMITSVVTCEMAARTCAAESLTTGVQIPPPPEEPEDDATPEEEPAVEETEPVKTHEPERKGPTFKRDAYDVDRLLAKLEGQEYSRPAVVDAFGVSDTSISNWKAWYGMPEPREIRKVREWMREWYDMDPVSDDEVVVEELETPDEEKPMTVPATIENASTVKITMQVPSDQIATALSQLLSSGRATLVNGNVELVLVVEKP